MLSRKNGKLSLNTLDLQIFLGELFYKCKTKSEVDFLLDNITGYAENVAEEVVEEEGLE